MIAQSDGPGLSNTDSGQILEHEIGLVNGTLSRTVAVEADCVQLGMEPLSALLVHTSAGLRGPTSECDGVRQLYLSADTSRFRLGATCQFTKKCLRLNRATLARCNLVLQCVFSLLRPTDAESCGLT